MTYFQNYHCHNCGNNFSIELLTDDEIRQARQRGEGLGQVLCPNCKRADYEKAA